MREISWKAHPNGLPLITVDGYYFDEPFLASRYLTDTAKEQGHGIFDGTKGAIEFVFANDQRVTVDFGSTFDLYSGDPEYLSKEITRRVKLVKTLTPSQSVLKFNIPC